MADSFVPVGGDDADMELGLDDDRAQSFDINQLDAASQRQHRQNTECMNQLRFAWKDVTKVVTNKEISKTLLNNVSGHVSATQCLAIMGPSGSGKTTLLDVLSNRSMNWTGEILVNGKKQSETPFRSLMGYVPQDDNMEGSLTVRESLLYVSMLAMAGDRWTPEKRLEKTDSVLRQLDLLVCADVYVGTVFLKGISGGQKRRVSMGMELITEPSILFLDEPTSGLDSASAAIVTDVLFGLAMLNYTILCTIHQPSTKIFTKFHLLCLLSAGKLAYFGPTSQAEAYFSKLGYPTPAMTNVADHYLDIINPSFGAKRTKMILDEFPKQLKPNVDKIASIGASGEESAPFAIHDHPTPLNNIKILLKRQGLVQRRNPALYGMRVVMYTMLGFFLGTLYLDLERSEEYIEDRISVLFFVAGFLTFMSISALPVFIEARAVYNRETFSEYYGPGAYCISASVAPLPILVFISLICCLVHYFAINLNQHDDSRFIFYVAALYVALYGAESLIVMVSAALPEFSTALVASACFFGASMLFCGFFILRENIPDYYIWITYGLSIHNYYFVALMVNEFNDINFKVSNPQPTPGSTEPADLIITGESILEDYGYEDESRAFNFVMMIVMSVVFRIFFYLFLKFGASENR